MARVNKEVNETSGLETLLMKLLSTKICLFWLSKAYIPYIARFSQIKILAAFALSSFKAWRLCLPIGILAALTLATPIRASKVELGVSCQSLSPDSASYGSTVRTITNTNTEIGKVNPPFRVLNTDDWRREPKIPWSVPVIIKDPFDGEYLTVFDHNFKYGSGVITNWSRNCIRTVVYENIGYYNGYFGSIPYYNGFSGGVQTVTAQAKTLEIKLGEQIFQLKGEQGNFQVDNKLAAALRNAPPGKAIIRITLEGSGASIVSDIGTKTVKAWKSVY